MKSSFIQKPEDAAFFSILAFLSSFAAAWILFYNIKMPEGWLGGMDGYFYASMMKNYLYQFNLTAIDPLSPTNYPQYNFYLVGMIARLFGIEAMHTVAWLAHIIAYIGYPALSFMMLRAIFSGRTSVLIILFSYVTGAYAWGFDHLWEKPHEIMALPGIFASLVFVAHLAGREIKNIDKIFAGLVLGFAFGSCTPFLVIPILSVAAIIGIDVLVRIGRKEPLFWGKYFDGYFLIPAIVIVLPYVVDIFVTNIRFHHGMGHVPAAFLHNLQHEYLIAGKASIVFIMAIAASGFALIYLACIRRLEYKVLYLILLVVLGVGLFTLVVTAYKYGFKHTSPFKYILQLPFALSVFLGMTTGYFLDWVESKGKPRIGVLITVVLVISSVTIPSLFVSKLMTRKHYELSYGLFAARSKNLASTIREISEIKKHRRLDRYLGAYEAMFLNVMVPGTFVSHIMFNESYASIYENVQQRAKELQEAADSKDSAAVLDYLKRYKIDILILSRAEDGVYKINHSETIGEDIQHPNTITVRKSLLEKMVNKRMLDYKGVDQYDLYLVN
jgi:hypothetical protein